ncbi:MAG: gas vesicle protein K [Chloroflexi bacterium]|nr:gas vesicle protein K [Chloroflexota bacterium]
MAQQSRQPVVLALDEKDLRNGLLALVVALVEIISEVLRLQAVKRMERGSLSEAQVERLGTALLRLEDVLEETRTQLGIGQQVQEVRDGLDRALDGLLERMLGPASLPGPVGQVHHASP